MNLSWTKGKAYTGWRKYIGKTAAGVPKCFYLGKARAQAEQKALKLTLAYKAILAAGGTGWTDEAVRAALEDRPIVLVAPAPVPADPPDLPIAAAAPDESGTAAAAPVVVARPNLMLHRAMDAYMGHEERRAPRQVSYAHLYGVRTRVRRLKEAMRDRPLASVGYDDLAWLVAHFASRPVSPHSGRRIGAVTATETVKCARTMFDWFDLSGRWDAPKRFERVFRVQRRSLMTADERDEEREGVETFTVEELVKIVGMAWSRWHRLFILAALNLAMTQFELSTLKRRHVIGLDTDSPRVEKCREKTKVFCRWGYVFPEVADGFRWLLSLHQSQTIFVTAHGKPPVRFYRDGRTDQVSGWWSRLVRRAGVRPLTFRYLRKTAADMVRKASDRDTSEAMLAHSNEGVAKFYTNHDWDKLATALRLLREQLQPVFDVPCQRPVIPRRKRSGASGGAQ